MTKYSNFTWDKVITEYIKLRNYALYLGFCQMYFGIQLIGNDLFNLQCSVLPKAKFNNPSKAS